MDTTDLPTLLLFLGATLIGSYVQSVAGFAMGMIITTFSYFAVTIDASTVKLPLTLVVVLIGLVAITIYLAYRFYQQDQKTQ